MWRWVPEIWGVWWNSSRPGLSWLTTLSLQCEIPGVSSSPELPLPKSTLCLLLWMPSRTWEGVLYFLIQRGSNPPWEIFLVASFGGAFIVMLYGGVKRGASIDLLTVVVIQRVRGSGFVTVENIAVWILVLVYFFSSLQIRLNFQVSRQMWDTR